MKKKIVDGCEAVASIAYNYSQVIPVYPITPSSPMAEYCTSASAHEQKNIWGQDVKTIEMQSEGGVAGTMHGALLSGALSSTFTSSQGLLLMLPNMFKMAGERLPGVIHVASRAVASHALNIFCDHSDIMAVERAGFIILCSSSVQEAHDLALAAHLLAIKLNMPVLHFMDGFRTSHELQKIDTFEHRELVMLANKYGKYIRARKGLTSSSPLQFGTAQNPDTFFQNKMASEKDYKTVEKALQEVFDDIAVFSGRHYAPNLFFGNKNAKNLIVSLGSSTEAIREEIEKSNIQDTQVCSIKLFRPFCMQIPDSVSKICVLERSKENFSVGPLTLDILSAAKAKEEKSGKKISVIHGIYGLGGKDFCNQDVKAVIDNIRSQNPKNNFTIGINDDENSSSLPLPQTKSKEKAFTIKVFGLGSDGSVSASKSTVKILGENHDKYVQGYFEYDSRKSGSMTISHIRICDSQIRSTYLVKECDVIMINNFSFVYKYNLLDGLKDNGIVIFNSIFSRDEIGKILPQSMTEILKNKNAKVFTINAADIARDCGLNEKINIIMMTALFKATNLLPENKIEKEIGEQIALTFGKKGSAVVEKNMRAMKMSLKCLYSVDNSSLVGKNRKISNFGRAINSPFVQNVQKEIAELRGNNIPVSAFSKDGSTPTATTQYEKRGIAQFLPQWIKENCVQCGQCVLACPHSALRAILVDEKACSSPQDFAKAIGINGALYKIQLSPLDCTGCGVCASACPALKKALEMTQANEILEEEKKKYLAYSNLAQLEQKVFADDYAKGLQFKKPYFEFSGACAGCGETPYIKLASTLFGSRMVIANATGCSSIYGGTYSSCPFVKDSSGRGPAWANSLFEDNAEFGLGIKLGLGYSKEKDESVWIIGGDGWAYDIGFGGLDHTLASGEDVNILVLDNESYSNTGGQSSKSTPIGATVKLAESAKRTHKKNLGQIAMTYDNVYVAQVALGADMSQCIKAFKEAEAHKGPSLIIAYSPCVNMGFNLKDMVAEQKAAVECGYFPLYRFDGKTLHLDSALNEDKYFDFLRNESRFSITLANKERAHLLEENKAHAVENYNKLKQKSEKNS